MYLVYKHTCPNGKIYVGITSMIPTLRWNNGKGYSGNEHFYNAILKYGWDNIKHEILFENLTKEEACQKEIELIAKYKSSDRKFGYNKSLGGDIPSDETKQRLREINLGKHHSKETCEKMSKSRKGKPHSKEHSAAIAKVLTGRKLSEENRRHLSESKKGSVPWNKSKQYHTGKAKTVCQYDMNGNLLCEYYSSNEAAKITGLSQGNIAACCVGKRRQTGGFIWQYKESAGTNIS